MKKVRPSAHIRQSGRQSVSLFHFPEEFQQTIFHPQPSVLALYSLQNGIPKWADSDAKPNDA
jgi:hypothetical protein